MLNSIKKLHFLLPFLFLISKTVLAQDPAECHGAFGDIAGGTTFGSGTSIYGPQLDSRNTGVYNFIQGQPSDGSYTLVKTTAGMNLVNSGRWHLATNHTPNDPNGYMMVINADYDPGIFYQATVNDLCPNTTYKFATYVLNLLKPPTAGGNPKLTFMIEDTNGNNLMDPYDAPEIEQSQNSPTWEERSTNFRTPANITSIVIKIRNNAPGGNGNDLALDDITFRACGPQITPNIDSAPATSLNICAGANKTVNLSMDVEPGVYAEAQFQWQELVNDIWTNLAQQTTTQTVVKIENSTVGVAKYRLLASEKDNINSANCRAASPEIVITTYPYPNPTASNNGPACIGEDIRLDVDETGTYEWRDPQGEIISTLKSFTISNATMAMTGTYTVKVTNIAGCPTTVPTIIHVLPPVEASVGNPELSKCEDDPAVQLEASGGASYSWSPSEGLSATNIANPVANPKNTTLYTVMVSNGACQVSATVNVIVHKSATATAGAGKKIMEGESSVLDGSVGANPTNFSWYWSPADGLDDPFKLRPIASPLKDITYTLNVSSLFGCNPASDQVFVRVYQKVTIPNTFSPNGDGTNDYWNIKALNTYPESEIKVMNREGETVFSSLGYANPWNGKYKGMDLPVGAYYYTITLNPELKKLSGWVMIVR